MFWYPKKRSPGNLTEDPENEPERRKAAWFFGAILIAVPLILLVLLLFTPLLKRGEPTAKPVPQGAPQ